MKHFFRAIATAALALALLCSLACGKDEQTETTTAGDVSSSAETTTAAPARVLTLVDGGASEFVIYRSKETGDASLGAINKLVSAIRAETGVTIKVVTDWGDAGQKDTDDAPAILIGKTSFAQSDVVQTLRMTQYTIAAEGNKLIIGGQDDDGTVAAIERFIADFVVGKGATLTFAEDQAVLEKGDFPMDTYLLCLGEPIEHYRIVIPDNADYGVIRCATEVSAHLTKLCGMVYPILTDAEAVDAGAYEILIGKTARTTVEPGTYAYDISAKGKTVQIVAGSWYAYEEATAAFKADIVPLRNASPITEETFRRDDLTSELKTASPSLMQRIGDVRVLIHNIWGNTSEGNMDARMMQTTLLHAGYDADVIGLQECSPAARSGQNSMRAGLISIGYTEVPAAAKNDKNNNYTPLFYRADRLELMDYGHVLFEGQNDSGSKGVTWGVFRLKASGKVFAVLTTHFWWKNVQAQDNADRESNARQVLAQIEAIEAKYACPVILGGDFNCNPSSSPYGLLTKGGLKDVQSWASRSENITTHHSYPTFDSELGLWDDPVPPSGAYSKSIDHLFAKGALVAERFDVVTDLYGLLSGDHCPLVGDFTLK